MLFELVKACPQHLEGGGTVLDLALLVLHRYDKSRRQMGDPHGGVGRVDRLATWACRAVDVDAKIARLDLDLDLIGLG